MSSITGPREAQLLAAVDLLLESRRTLAPLATLPPELTPTTPEEAVFLQSTLAAAYGPFGGWKVGAANPTATPSAAPMPAAWIAATGATFTSRRYRGLEAEIAFLLAHDLPPRAAPYTSQETYAAVASCHPAIEILETAFLDPDQVPPLAKTADLQIHGGFVYGPAIPDWQSVDFSIQPVTLAIDGILRVQRTGSNTAGDLRRLLPWLANQHTLTGGLRAGQWITTGSWTGSTCAGPTSTAHIIFSGLGEAQLRFA